MSAPTTNIPFSNPQYRNHHFYRRYGKRALDFTGALFGLICLFPVLAILAILLAIVQRTSPFFLQKRIGHGLKPFHIIKFKTMKDTRDKGTCSRMKNAQQSWAPCCAAPPWTNCLNSSTFCWGT